MSEIDFFFKSATDLANENIIWDSFKVSIWMVLISFKAYRDKCQNKNQQELLSQTVKFEREYEVNLTVKVYQNLQLANEDLKL